MELSKPKSLRILLEYTVNNLTQIEKHTDESLLYLFSFYTLFILH